MTDGGFAYSHLFAKDLPPPAPRWTGFPKHNFIGGHNDPASIPAAALAEAATAVLRRRGADLALYNFDGPQGYAGLRQLVVNKLAQRPAIKCTVDDVLITTGSGQAIDLVNGLLLERGDTVILEEFTYGGALTKLKRLGVNVVGAPLDDEGLKIDGLARIIEDLGRKGIRPKYVYTIPTVQNPTGSILPRERREALLALTRKHGVPVFEDECYADLTWEGAGPPSLYAMDPQQVIHIGSFSKTLAPSLRLGYAVAVPEVMSRLVACKREADSGTGALDQMVVAEYFSQNFGEHVGGLTQTLRDKLDAMVEAVEREFGTTVEKMWKPKGGIFLWLKLPDRVDVTKLVAPAA
jgi:2-aminoadipate transaminase